MVGSAAYRGIAHRLRYSAVLPAKRQGGTREGETTTGVLREFCPPCLPFWPVWDSFRAARAMVFGLFIPLI